MGVSSVAEYAEYAEKKEAIATEGTEDHREEEKLLDLDNLTMEYSYDIFFHLYICVLSFFYNVYVNI